MIQPKNESERAALFEVERIWRNARNDLAAIKWEARQKSQKVREARSRRIREFVPWALENKITNKSRVCAYLGISRSTLDNILKGRE